MDSIFFSINGVDICLSQDFSRRKLVAVKEVLHMQLKGMINVFVPGMVIKKIFLEPYEDSKEFVSESVPGVYKFREHDNKLFFIANKISLRVFRDTIYYGLDSIYGFSIHFLYFLCVIFSNKTLVHAAAFKINGKNVLIPAFGGIGKTFLVSKLSENFKNLVYGDDLVILDEQGRMYPYYRPMCVYKYHYQNYLKDRLRTKLYYLSPSLLWRVFLRFRFEILDKFGIKFTDMSRATYSKGYVTVPIKDILKKQQMPIEGGKIDKILLIKRKSVAVLEKKLLFDIEKSHASNYVSSIIYHEWADYSKMIFAFSAFLGGEIISQIQKTESLVNRVIYASKEVWCIDIPINATDSDIEEAVLSVL